ncbi:hypothetical protein PM10SUCC1_30630 [Propionigenium maris DSM 9537]|uniref:Uncharacterized protein n=1 Tax=Propionigenium maris DSM 9537 TaxID=1123000 RepID=A0A9W6GLZ9_9FUSO|nr:hypothetical protein [Propionigenium maris]GLI57549.1 hypothetical protein PM10SUCC1_30630 [Propionigenium maris DSM 9537]
MNLKKIYVVSIVSLAVFLSSGIYCYLSLKGAEEELERELKILEDEGKQVLELKRKKSEEKVELSKNLKILKGIREMEEEISTLDELNTFVKKFEGIRKKYRGVNEVAYEVLEEESKVSINLSFQDTYNNIRKFLYEVEKTFFFLEVKYLKIETDGGRVKGNFNIQVYFRSSKGEG